jgi:hypothetical protein
MIRHGISHWLTAKELLKYLKMNKPKENISWDSAHYGRKLNRMNMKAKKINGRLAYQSNREERLEMPQSVLTIRILKTLSRVKNI